MSAGVSDASGCRVTPAAIGCWRAGGNSRGTVAMDAGPATPAVGRSRTNPWLRRPQQPPELLGVSGRWRHEKPGDPGMC